MNDLSIKRQRISRHIGILVTRREAFQIYGCAGLFLASVLGTILSISQGLSSFVMISILGTAICTFFSTAMLTKILSGHESLTYYHHQITLLLVVSALLKILNEPILPYLDITVLGIGIFLSCGRIGCLMAGCCHGKPHSWGIYYSEGHARKSIASHLVGVTLLPVQLLESFWVLLIVLGGSLCILSNNYRAGDALALYVIMYGFGRFFIEFLRGDPDRRYFAGFSEAQWTSLILMTLVAACEIFDMLKLSAWHPAAVIILICFFVAIAINRKFFRRIHPENMSDKCQ